MTAPVTESSQAAAAWTAPLGMNGVGGGGSEDGPDLDAFANTDLNLCDHLLAQAGTAFDAADIAIAAQLIDQIDDTGYLTASLLDVANRLGVPLARVEAVLATIQTFDPTGVGARDLSECLALQAKEADPLRPLHGAADRPSRPARARRARAAQAHLWRR